VLSPRPPTFLKRFFPGSKTKASSETLEAFVEIESV